MSIKTSIVSGEAAETDSEDESSDITNAFTKMAASIPGEIVNGEDSESDTDSTLNKTPKIVAQPAEISVNPLPPKKKFDSLLHKKLCENNTTVYKNMNNFFTSHANDANLSLNHTDRQLMKSQLTLQAALNSLRLLHTNSVAIKNKLRNIVVDDNYLDNLVITKN